MRNSGAPPPVSRIQIIERVWGAFDPQEFERLCFDLLGKVGLRNRTWHGRGGGDKGRDVVGETSDVPVPFCSITRRWVVQCKRYRSFPSKASILEDLAAATEHRPDYWLLVVSCHPTSNDLDFLRSVDGKHNIRVLFWCRPQLEELLSLHLDIARKYFGGPPAEWADDFSNILPTVDAEVFSWISPPFAWDEVRRRLYRLNGTRYQSVFDAQCARPVMNFRKLVATVVPDDGSGEDKGEIHLVSANSVHRIQLPMPNPAHAPESVVWWESDYLLAIRAYIWGHSDNGGDILAVDINRNRFGVLIKAERTYKPDWIGGFSRGGLAVSAYDAGDNYRPPIRHPIRVVPAQEVDHLLSNITWTDMEAPVEVL